MNSYIVLIKNNNDLVAEYVLDLHGDDFVSHKKYVLDILKKDFEYLDVDVTQKYCLELLSIDFKKNK